MCCDVDFFIDADVERMDRSMFLLIRSVEARCYHWVFPETYLSRVCSILRS